mmetsp:Transcript_4647/g.11714  ORF Transcript_4647/g.11714 Transcript_4647/m.11714 type:complete len:745 (-) Transcript_4647:309-2543(-)
MPPPDTAGDDVEAAAAAARKKDSKANPEADGLVKSPAGRDSIGFEWKTTRGGRRRSSVACCGGPPEGMARGEHRTGAEVGTSDAKPSSTGGSDIEEGGKTTKIGLGPRQREALCFDPPTSNDMLLGQTSKRELPCHGNAAYRALLEKNRARYWASKNRDERTRIVTQIIDGVKSRNPPGRFLVFNDYKGYREVDDDEIVRKKITLFLGKGSRGRYNTKRRGEREDDGDGGERSASCAVVGLDDGANESQLVDHDYTDYAVATEDDLPGDEHNSSTLPPPDPAVVHHPSPNKLLEVLDRGDLDDMIAWMPHGRAFLIKKPERLTADVLPRFFNQTKFLSFTRQLNVWGFKQITRGADAGAYYHELLLRGRPRLVARMRRPRIEGTTGWRAPLKPNPDAEPDFYKPPPSERRSQRRSSPPLPPMPAKIQRVERSEEAAVVDGMSEGMPRASGGGRDQQHRAQNATMIGRDEHFLGRSPPPFAVPNPPQSALWWGPYGYQLHSFPLQPLPNRQELPRPNLTPRQGNDDGGSFQMCRREGCSRITQRIEGTCALHGSKKKHPKPSCTEEKEGYKVIKETKEGFKVIKEKSLNRDNEQSPTAQHRNGEDGKQKDSRNQAPNMGVSIPSLDGALSSTRARTIDCALSSTRAGTMMGSVPSAQVYHGGMMMIPLFQSHMQAAAMYVNHRMRTIMEPMMATGPSRQPHPLYVPPPPNMRHGPTIDARLVHVAREDNGDASDGDNSFSKYGFL